MGTLFIYPLTLYIENTNDEHDLKITNFNIKIPEKILLLKKPKDAAENNKIITWKHMIIDPPFILQLMSFINTFFACGYAGIHPRCMCLTNDDLPFHLHSSNN